MEKMGGYCKAYPIPRLRGFSGWTEKSENARKEKKEVEGEVDGKEVEAPRELTDNDFLYLQDNFTVTDGVFIDQNVIFEEVNAEWIDFCKSNLEFKIPEYQIRRAEETPQEDNQTGPQAGENGAHLVTS